MRLHRLEVTAFGPFTGTVHVDFDRLSDAGLFLLSGATGAGKTSVLDAVCFALYGDVPGDRSTAKRLRADLADPEVAPRVELEVTLSGRRFRIVRTPSWQRPKKRGRGTTTAQASVQVAERVDGAWVVLATRLDEAGQLVSGLVGMTLTQFTQVAMLPQGRFQTFLRAGSDERHKLLHQLFRTGRFEAVEAWLRERRLSLRREAEESHRSLADLVSRTSETVAAPLPDGWDVHDLTGPASDGSLSAWVAGLCDGAQQHSVRSAEAVSASAVAEAATRQALDDARALVSRRSAIDAARLQHSDLEAEASAIAAAREAAEAATRAESVRPVAQIAGRAEAALAAARAAAPQGDSDRETLAAAEQAAVDAAAAVRAALPREAEVRDVSARMEADEARLGLLPSLVRAAELRVLIAAADEHVRLVRALAGAREAHLAARSTALDLGEALLDLRQARIDGMAAELAGGLAVGASCPVCGSAEHPRPAVAAPDAPDDAAEKAAMRALDDAKAVEHLRSVEVRDLETALGAGSERGADRPVAQLRSELAELAVPDTDIDTEALAAEQVRLTAALDHHRKQRDAAAADVAALLADHDVPDLATLLQRHLATARSAREALRALDDLAAATTAHEDATTALDEVLAAVGFHSRDAAAKALLTPERLDRLRGQVRDHERRLAAVAAILDAPDVDAVSAVALPDLVALRATHAGALETLGTTRAEAERWARRAHRLHDLAGRLADALDRWRPLHDEWQLTAELSAFCEGKAADNRLQMRLSAYVLAFRLSQVVAAANERLARMSDQRYSLEHTGRAGVGETRGGLSLLVRDDWSGESRDPATLSGGETFVVSLALALGLADVITHEAGGADLDTLFVDEGFGSLDADTLDDVLDTLDGLRDGGRVVGVVSHVAEMRDRIPTQLVVSKSRSGSTLSVRG